MVWQSFMEQWLYALLDSIWQFALMWCLFLLGKQLISKKHLVSFAFLLVNTSLFWFIYQLLFSASITKQVLQQPTEKSFSRWPVYYNTFSDWIVLVATCFHLILLFWYLRKLFIGMLDLSRLKRTSSKEDLWGVEMISRSIAQSLHLKKEFQFLYSTSIRSPLMAGHFKPFLIFPLPMMNELTLDQLKLLIVHEYAHLLHRDYLLNFWMKILECIFFFNPFFKKLAFAIEFEMECRTDAQVIKSSNQSRGYIELLLQMAKQENQKPILAKWLNGNSDMLLQRVKRMLGVRSKDSNALSLKYWTWLLFSILTSVYIQYNKGQSIQRTVTKKNESFKVIQQPINTPNLNSSSILNKEFVKKYKQKVHSVGKPPKKQDNDEISLRIASTLNTIHQDLISISWVLSNPYSTIEMQSHFVATPSDSLINQPTEYNQFKEMVSSIVQLNALLMEEFNPKILAKESDLSAFTNKLNNFRKKLEEVQNFIYKQSPIVSTEEKGLEFTERMMNLNALLDHHKIAMEFWINLALQSKQFGKSGNKQRIVDL